MTFDSHIVFLATNDLSAMSRFYEETLGLPLALDQGKCRIYRVAREGYIGFCEREYPPSVEGVIITIVTQHVDEYYDMLRARRGV